MAVGIVLLSYLLYDEVRIFIYKQCKFDPDGPIPVILIALGRSGSSVTWDTIARMTGEPTPAYEFTGQNLQKSLEFFKDIRYEIGPKWAALKLCSIQKKRTKDAGIIGFQWKPFRDTFFHKYAIGALNDIGDRMDPPIRVIFLKRNPLDRKISNLRHIANNLKVPAHCKVGDEACIEQHKAIIKQGGGVEFPMKGELLSWLKTEKTNNDEIREQLSLYGIKYITVSYEKLYHSETAEEWMRIFSFLGKGPSQDLTIEEVRSTFSMAATTSTKRSESISNYGNVENALKGTQYEYLLYE